MQLQKNEISRNSKQPLASNECSEQGCSVKNVGGHAHRVRRDTGLIVFSDITLMTRFHPKCLGDKSHRGNVFTVTVLKPECVQG